MPIFRPFATHELNTFASSRRINDRVTRVLMQRRFIATFTIVATLAAVSAQTPAREQLARGRALWDQRLSKSAMAALETASRDRATAAEAHEALGRIYTFKGWQQEGVFPGWHDEPAYRQRAIAELKAALAADPKRASAQDALHTAEGFAAADRVDPAAPRAEIKELDAKLESFRTTPAAPLDNLLAAIDARTKAQADVAPYFTGAQILIDRLEYVRAIDLAERGATAGDRFVRENLSAY